MFLQGKQVTARVPGALPSTYGGAWPFSLSSVVIDSHEQMHSGQEEQMEASKDDDGGDGQYVSEDDGTEGDDHAERRSR